jgi:hypothetical protein
MELPATTTEYVRIPVAPPPGNDNNRTPPPHAFLPVSNRSNPTVTDWQTGAWANGTEARLLIGPDGGAITLAAGDYRVYVSFDPPGSENIVRLSGYLGIT